MPLKADSEQWLSLATVVGIVTSFVTAAVLPSDFRTTSIPSSSKQFHHFCSSQKTIQVCQVCDSLGYLGNMVTLTCTRPRRIHIIAIFMIFNGIYMRMDSLGDDLHVAYNNNNSLHACRHHSTWW